MPARLGLGGGCHWCTEAVFQALRGVADVAQGFIASLPPDDAFSEAVLVDHDPTVIPAEALVEIHLRTHAATSAHSMRGKYRSAVYVADPPGGEEARAILARLSRGFDAPLVTRVLPLIAFRPSDARFRNYYRTDPSRPFCTTYIDPKLALLRREFARHVATGDD